MQHTHKPISHHQSEPGTKMSRIAPEGNVNRTRRELTASNSALSKEIVALASGVPGLDAEGLPSTIMPPSSTSVMQPSKKKNVASCLSELDAQDNITSRSCFQAFKVCKTSEELMFLLWARHFGLRAAIEEAAKARWQFQRPLQVLLSTSSEPDKNCNTQSVAQEPPSS